MKKNRLYFIILAGCLGGITWTVLNLTFSGLSTICIVRNVSGIPCPSCGITRSIHSLFHADWLQAIQLNLLGPVMLLLMLILPVWILSDLYRKSDSFNTAYQKMEMLLRKRAVYIPFAILIISNWVWNILKEI